MSEKSTRKAPDYAVEFRAARNRFVYRPQLRLCVAILLKSGIICANQGRKRRFQYAYVFCLGVSPATVQAWLIPKAIAWEHATPQHGGAIGKDTKWLCFQADSPPKWMSDYGGSLAEVLRIIKKQIPA